jgi:hypothetical protein
LQDIYRQIAYDILSRAVQINQLVSTVGNVTKSILYPDSYIEINYTPISERADYDEIGVNIEEKKFTSCNPSFEIPGGIRVSDAKVTSYSGEHWTDSLIVNSIEVFNLSSYSINYVKLGDPFYIYVPVNYIVNGTNTINILTADSPENKTGCSLNDTIIYTGFIKASISYADVLPKSEGCTWNLEFDDGAIEQIKVPKEYSGPKICNYTSTDHLSGYDAEDSIDTAAYKLFYDLDYNNDGKIFVNIAQYHLLVNAISVQQIPYPWGPATIEFRVWK